MKRRDFVTKALGLLALAGLEFPVSAWSAISGTSAAGDSITNPWPGLLKQRFRVYDPASKRRLTVVLTDYTESLMDTSIRQFTLNFRSSRRVALAEGTYMISHRKTGSISLHMQPAGEQSGGHYYLANFSLLA